MKMEFQWLLMSCAAANIRKALNLRNLTRLFLILETSFISYKNYMSLRSDVL